MMQLPPRHRIAMPTPDPDDFWKLVATSRIVAADLLASLRREYEAEEAGRPAANAAATTTAIAKWLVKRGSLTKWQARRLLTGDGGPFFVGDYRLLERLESEGPGRLFRARHEPSGRSICLMVLDQDLCRRPEVWAEVVRRTTIAHEAIDPVLSRTWALEPVLGKHCIVCEDVEGPALADELARRGPLPPVEACRLVLPIVRAVAELHRRGAVHGALSLDAVRCEPEPPGSDSPRPANGVPGRIRLLQLPLVGDPHAVIGQPSGDSTERISRLGRRASFVAPELTLPGSVCDRRSDVYALGCILHAALTGVPPCWQGDAQRTLSHVAIVGPEPLGPPRVPVEIATLVSHFVCRDPAARYPDAAEAGDALAACIGLPPVSNNLPPQVAISGTASGPAALVTAGASTATTQAADPAKSSAAATLLARKRSARLRMLGLGVGGGIIALALAFSLPRGSRRQPPRDDDGPRDSQTQEHVAHDPDQKPPQKPEQKPAPGKAPVVEKDTTQGSGGATQAAAVTIVDSPDLPWASPTSGRPPTLAYLPPGSQLILLTRPAELVAEDEGRRFIQALGPRVERGIADLEAACGCGLDGVEELLAGWQAGGPDTGAGEVAGGVMLRFLEPSPLDKDAEARERAWGKTTPEKLAGETLHHASGKGVGGGGFSYWLPKAEGGRVLAIAPAPLLKQMVAEAGGSAADDDALQANLPQDLQQLVTMLDRSRHLTLFGAPQYLLNDGRPVMAGPLAKLVEPLSEFCGEGVHAAALSLHFGPNFYAEFDAVATRSEPAKKLSKGLAERIDTLADTVEDYCASVNPHPYGKKLVLRLHTMIRTLAANARCGAEGKGVVLNAYLPRHAAHNLALATELALEQSPGQGGGPAAPSGAATAAAMAAGLPKGAAAQLQKKISLTFVKDTLEKSIQMVSDEIGVPMEILGTDLQLEGITKNQSFGLEERDQPAESVLRTILAKSNPDGKLVYVIRNRDGVESIEITTRAAAAKRGDTLPAVFAEKK
jgi:serine/threonine-protein kinase